MVPVVVIRPEPGCSATVAAARDARMDARGYPLFEVMARSWEAANPARFDALIVGSANVFRFGGPGLAALAGLPVYAVGESTAEAARAAGFVVAATGSTGMQGLLGLLAPGHRRLLRLAGEERVNLTLPEGVSMEERVVYVLAPRPFPPELVTLLGDPAIIVLHSAEAARHLAAQCVSNGLRRARLRIAALSPRIAAAAGDGWGEVAAPALIEDKALLALARQMCQDPWPAGRNAGT